MIRPAVYCLEATANDTDPAFYEREFAKESQREEFFSANAALRRFYDGMIDQIAAAVGPLQDLSVLDVGCNTGYFPLAFARRGARQAKGIDRIDYSPTISPFERDLRHLGAIRSLAVRWVTCCV